MFHYVVTERFVDLPTDFQNGDDVISFCNREQARCSWRCQRGNQILHIVPLDTIVKDTIEMQV